jgi:hypothetical protein
MNEHEKYDERRGGEEQERLPPEARVRDEDLEPFAALRYIARLFKLLALLLLFLLAAEVILGLLQAGVGSLPGLLVEATRLLVFAGFLWGAGDMTLMLIETNHDLRAIRILVARLHREIERFTEGGPPNV